MAGKLVLCPEEGSEQVPSRGLSVLSGVGHVAKLFGQGPCQLGKMALHIQQGFGHMAVRGRPSRVQQPLIALGVVLTLI